LLQSHVPRAKESWSHLPVYGEQSVQALAERIMEGYVDDMLVKSMTFDQYLLDLEEVFLYVEQISNEVQSFQVCVCYQGREVLGVPSE